MNAHDSFLPLPSAAWLKVAMVDAGPPLTLMVAALMSTSDEPSYSRTVVSTVRATSMRSAAVVGIMSISLLMSRRTTLSLNVAQSAIVPEYFSHWRTPVSAFGEPLVRLITHSNGRSWLVPFGSSVQRPALDSGR